LTATASPSPYTAKPIVVFLLLASYRHIRALTLSTQFATFARPPPNCLCPQLRLAVAHLLDPLMPTLTAGASRTPSSSSQQPPSPPRMPSPWLATSGCPRFLLSTVPCSPCIVMPVDLLVDQFSSRSGQKRHPLHRSAPPQPALTTAAATAPSPRQPSSCASPR
jgi:hypothetical protein